MNSFWEGFEKRAGKKIKKLVDKLEQVTKGPQGEKLKLLSENSPFAQFSEENIKKVFKGKGKFKI